MLDDSDMPLDHAALVLDEFATEEECDTDMTETFWGWYGPDSDEEEEE